MDRFSGDRGWEGERCTRSAVWVSGRMRRGSSEEGMKGEISGQAESRGQTTLWAFFRRPLKERRISKTQSEVGSAVGESSGSLKTQKIQEWELIEGSDQRGKTRMA